MSGNACRKYGVGNLRNWPGAMMVIFFVGRFAGRGGGGKDALPLGDGRTSSTRISGQTRLSVNDDENIKEADALAEFLDTELKTFFGASADAKLFIKVLCADGIVPKLLSQSFSLRSQLINT